MSTQAEWIYRDVSGQARGPLDAQQIAALVRSGEITPTSDVRPPDAASWSLAVALLPDLFSAPAPPDIAGSTWTDRAPHPWRRYLARMVDALVVGGLAWFVVGVAAFSLAPEQASAFFKILDGPGGPFIDIILTQVIVIPFNAAAIGLTGLSLGKWIFGIRVSKAGSPMGFRAALRRELSVFLFGLGCGIPFAALFTLIGAYNQLKDDKITAWDRAQRLSVAYRPDSRAARIGMAAAVVLLVIGKIGLQALARA